MTQCRSQSLLFPRGDDENLDVLAPRDGPGGSLMRRLLWSGGANAATHEEVREVRDGAGSPAS